MYFGRFKIVHNGSSTESENHPAVGWIVLTINIRVYYDVDCKHFIYCCSKYKMYRKSMRSGFANYDGDLEWLIALVLLCQLNIYSMCFVCFNIIGCLNIQSSLLLNSYDLISILMTYPILRAPCTTILPHTHIQILCNTSSIDRSSWLMCIATRVKKCYSVHVYFSSVSCFSCHNK